jgi:Zn ribbon nucleic-acid-binding protein
LFDKYIQISKEEIERFFLDKSTFVDINCPACNSNKKNKAFKKFGMEYVECEKCKSVYLSPRPTEKAINHYLKESKASEFWIAHFIGDSVKARSEKIFKPRAEWVINLTKEYFNNPKIFVDIKSKYAAFLEEIDRLDLFDNIIPIDPLIEISKLSEKGSKIIVKDIESYNKENIKANVITAFEVIERSYNPEKFLKSINNLMVDSGLLFFTGRNSTGFDMQILWGESKNIIPFDHINILSIEGAIALFERCGFEIIELSTPGQLDVDMVISAIDDNKELKPPRFISYLIHNRDENAHRVFQEFLQQFRLSSHLRIAAQKKVV